MNNGILIVLSGPSGVGKDTVLKKVFEIENNLKPSISVTTRKPRAGEEDNVHYFFKTREDFLQMLAEDKFLEHEDVYGNFYGTPKDYVDAELEKGFDVILEIDTKGALSVKEKRNDAIMIFLAPPSITELKSRLSGRGTESEEEIEIRTSSAKAELDVCDFYDYIVINEEPLECAKEILAIIHSEKNKVERNKDFISLLKGENEND